MFNQRRETTLYNPFKKSYRFHNLKPKQFSIYAPKTFFDFIDSLNTQNELRKRSPIINNIIDHFRLHYNFNIQPENHNMILRTSRLSEEDIKFLESINSMSFSESVRAVIRNHRLDPTELKEIPSYLKKRNNETKELHNTKIHISFLISDDLYAYLESFDYLGPRNWILHEMIRTCNMRPESKEKIIKSVSFSRENYDYLKSLNMANCSESFRTIMRTILIDPIRFDRTPPLTSFEPIGTGIFNEAKRITIVGDLNEV
jgi:hypothetical protein